MNTETAKRDDSMNVADGASSETRLPNLVIVANRLPLASQETPDANKSWVLSPGGLVAALIPVAKKYSATWVGWAGHDTDPPATFAGVNLASVPLKAEEIAGYYSGFANSTLWPLAHGRIDLASFDVDHWQIYRDVNKKFAEQVASVALTDSLVWVHDYHLFLVPELLKKIRPDLRVGFFLHIPAMLEEETRELSVASEIYRGFLAADTIGVQSQRDLANIRSTILTRQWSDLTERLERVHVTPVSLDPGVFDAELGALNPSASSTSVRASHFVFPGADHPNTSHQNRFRFLGVDRLDYSKGIPERLMAFEEHLESIPVDQHLPTLTQVLVPTREEIPAYRQLRERVEQLSNKINKRFGTADYAAVTNIFQNLEPEKILPLYRACDALIVSAVRDGMNLVAKEFVASRHDNDGVLVLSRLAGAADELQNALQIDPQNHDEFAAALETARTMPQHERNRRMERMRQTVSGYTATEWADRNLALLQK